MNVKNLEIGKEYKNYSELCEALGIEPKISGESKISQIKNIERFIKYTKNGHKFIIDKIYDNPIPKKENIRSKKYPITEYKKEHVNFILNTFGCNIDDLYVHSKIMLHGDVKNVASYL